MLTTILLVCVIVLIVLILAGVPISERMFKVLVLVILALDLLSGTTWGGHYLR